MSDATVHLQAQGLLRRYGLKPRKSLGQNFLINEGARELILNAAGLEDSDEVLEIGPGLGALTQSLVDRARRVVSVELDPSLYAILQDMLGARQNLDLIQGNFLDIEMSDLGLDPGFVVVANIPYNITSAIIRKVMESEARPARAVLTVQKEVAERVVAGPGEMSLLALSVQLFGTPSIDAVLASGSFFPRPSVDSAVIRVEMDRAVNGELVDMVFVLARAGFAQRRKKLRNSLAHGLPMDKEEVEGLLHSSDIDPDRRPQTLKVDEWLSLAKECIQGRQ